MDISELKVKGIKEKDITAFASKNLKNSLSIRLKDFKLSQDDIKKVIDPTGLRTSRNNFSSSISLSQTSIMQTSEMRELVDGFNKIKNLKNVLSHSPDFDYFRTLNNFLNKDVYKILSNLQNSPFPPVEDFPSIIDTEGFDSENILIPELETEVTQEISSVNDYNLLSPRTKKVLNSFFIYFILPYFISNLPSPTQIYVFASSITLSQNASTKTAQREYSQYISQESLKYFRTITVHNINLRNNPNLLSAVTIALPINTLVEVVDKSDKSWLLVRVHIDDEIIVGWVLRRYTDNLR